MINRVELTNFKCFEHLDLPCRPLNLLCGFEWHGQKQHHSSAVGAPTIVRDQ